MTELFTSTKLRSLGLFTTIIRDDRFDNFKLTKVGRRLKLKRYNRLHAKSFIHAGRSRRPRQGLDTPRTRRGDNMHRAKMNLVDIARCNYTNNTRFVTLTFKDTVLDRDFALKLFEKMIPVLTYALCRSTIDYAYVMERQKERGLKEGNAGTWHFHILFFNIPYFKNETFSALFWPHGFVKIKKLDNPEYTAFYFAKYFTKDMADLNNVRAYSCSRYLRRPEVIEDMATVFAYLHEAIRLGYVIETSKAYVNPYTKSTTVYHDLFPT